MPPHPRPYPRRLLLAAPLLGVPRPALSHAALLLRWPGGAQALDRAALDRAEREELRTHTPWTRGTQHFEGRRLLPLLPEALRAAPGLAALGLDGYRAAIPREDLHQHGLFLAWRRNGALMPVRDRGPFWLLYPWAARPELDQPVYHRRAVWQLQAIEAA